MSGITLNVETFLLRVRGALFGLFISDAISMPVHWYYDISALVRDFGTITYYNAPKDKHPTSIMNLASKSVGGRKGWSSTQSPEVVGNVILQGKEHLWGRPNTHYHHGMKAGENTLNLLCNRVLIRTIPKNLEKYGKLYDPNEWLQNYVDFMTTPQSHNDTYADSYHRDFFANYQQQKLSGGELKLDQLAGEENHDTASIGALMTIPVVAISTLISELKTRGKSDGHQISHQEFQEILQKVKQISIKHLFFTHKSPKLATYGEIYIEILLRTLLLGPQEPPTKIRDIIDEVAVPLQIRLKDLVTLSNNYSLESTLPLDRKVSNSFGIACYISDSMPVALYIVYKYADNFLHGILTNTNCGGENCGRSAVLGALLGSTNGYTNIPENLVHGLADYQNINKEVDDFTSALKSYLDDIPISSNEL